MSSQNTPIPYFPLPPREYDVRYFSEILRSFTIFAQQVTNPGPGRFTEITLTESGTNVDRGQLSWNAAEDTLDLTMGGGVIQQVGYETYMYVKNDTGSTITNGTVVGFSGVNSEILISPYTANSSANELYFVGVTTRDMADQDTGPVTIYGKVRGLDTTGPGAETWVAGDILYASPTTAGGFTKVRPTAPNVVIPVAAVLSVDATDGEIMVRPTIPMSLDYGTFDSTSSQTLAAVNTATAITLGNTLSSNGVTLGSPASRMVVAQSGYYNVGVTLQLSSGSSSAKTVYVWLRKNGSNVTDTTRAITVDINNGYVPVSVSYPISLAASDYVELYWASNDTNVSLAPITGLAFAPDSPSVLVTVTQNQL